MEWLACEPMLGLSEVRYRICIMERSARTFPGCRFRYQNEGNFTRGEGCTRVSFKKILTEKAVFIVAAEDERMRHTWYQKEIHYLRRPLSLAAARSLSRWARVVLAINKVRDKNTNNSICSIVIYIPYVTNSTLQLHPSLPF